MIKSYYKLVRDKIPQIIEEAGKSCSVRVLDEQAYREALRQKLQEEVDEYVHDQRAEELADIIEVIHALASVHGISHDGLEQIRQSKHDSRGGFDKRLFLEQVTEA